MTSFKILDCTLRDGGYYTSWDFAPDLVDQYLRSFQGLPVEFVEVGYRSLPAKGYLGEYYYLPVSRLEAIRAVLPETAKIAVMVDEKNCASDQLHSLMEPCRGLVDMVRFTVAPDKIDQGLALAGIARDMGFETGVNLMYLSRMDRSNPGYRKIAAAGDAVSYLYLVDSYGAVMPNDMREHMRWARDLFPQRLGFHGHNNVGLAFANALVAIEEGADIIDSTVQGMGRGAGNLETELLVSYVNARGQDGLIDMSRLADLSSDFMQMRAEYGWGMSFPYIVSGFGDLPQKDVMDWLALRRFSTASIVRTLQSGARPGTTPGTNAQPDDLLKMPDLELGQPVVLIGGGSSIAHTLPAICEFVSRKGATVVHSTLTHVAAFASLGTPQIACLAGDEALKLDFMKDQAKHLAACVVSSDTAHAEMMLASGLPVFQVQTINDTHSSSNQSPMTESPAQLALGVAHTLAASPVYLAGFDGYAGTGDGEAILARETQGAFDDFMRVQPDGHLISLTPTRYDVVQDSVYAYIF